MRRAVLYTGTLGLAALAVSFIIDLALIEATQKLQTPWMDVTFGILTHPAFVTAVLLLFPLAVLLYRRKTALSALIISSFFFSGALVFFLKLAFARARPEVAALTIPDLTIYAFPSMHAALAFSVIPLLWNTFPKLRIPVLGVAILVTFSRLYFGVHYLSDLIAGALIGLAMGYLLWRSHER